MRKAFNICYRIVSTIVIVFGLMLALLYLCGIRLYCVKTGSMKDQVPEGSLCFVSSYSSFDKVKVGDVIAFYASDDMLVTHRAVKITDEGIITRGDANNTDDGDPVTKKNYIGKTVFAIPKVGKVLSGLKTGTGLAVLGTVIALIFVAGFFYRPERKRSDAQNRNPSEEKDASGRNPGNGQGVV